MEPAPDCQLVLTGNPEAPCPRPLLEELALQIQERFGNDALDRASDGIVIASALGYMLYVGAKALIWAYKKAKAKRASEDGHGDGGDGGDGGDQGAQRRWFQL